MANDSEADIVSRLRRSADFWEKYASDGPKSPFRDTAALVREAADNIEFMRKQSRGHFDAMTAVLRDGIKAVVPEEFRDNLPDPKPQKAN